MLRELIKRRHDNQKQYIGTPDIIKKSAHVHKTENQKRSERAIERYQLEKKKLETPKNIPFDNEINSMSTNIPINWKYQLGNNAFTFGLTQLFRNNIIYSLVQFTGYLLTDNKLFNSESFNIVDIPDDIDLTQGSDFNSAVVLYNTNGDDGLINVNESFILWLYNGTQQNYNFVNMVHTSIGDLIVLSNFNGTVTFTNNLLPPNEITLDSIKGSYFISKFDAITLRSVWRVQLSAMNSDNVHLTIDNNNNIYLIGTYQGTVTINDTAENNPQSTSNLLTDIFIAKINSNGEVVWLFSSLKVGANTSTGAIKGESITFSNGTLGIIGTNNQRFSYQGPNGTTVTVENQFIPFNMWVMQIDTDGNPIWITNPTSNFMIPIVPPGDIPLALLTESFVDGSQIIYNNNYYICGTFSGDFTFNQQVNSNNTAIFVAKLSSSGVWQNIVYIVADIPPASNRSPCITILNNIIYLGFFAVGNQYVFYKDNNPVEPFIAGSGSVDLVTIKISETFDLVSYLKICGTYSNSSYFISSGGNSVYSIGTHLLTLQNSDSFLISIES